LYSWYDYDEDDDYYCYCHWHYFSSSYWCCDSFECLLLSRIEEADDDLLRCEVARGKCQVMCFHPRSNITLPLMSHDEIRLVIDEWAKLNTQLGQNYSWVQVCLPTTLTTHLWRQPSITVMPGQFGLWNTKQPFCILSIWYISTDYKYKNPLVEEKKTLKNVLYCWCLFLY